MTHRLLRSHLYVPADRERFVAKAHSTNADAVILDLEDSVADSRKNAALDAALVFLAEEVPEHTTAAERWVRVNVGDRGIAELRSLLPLQPDGIWLPKSEPGGWTADAVAMITAAGVRPGVMIESAVGLVGLAQLPTLPPNALTQLGEVDLAADLRMRDRSEEAMVPFRARIILETAIRGLPMPVAPVGDRYDDLDEYRARSIVLRDRGFGSRACIHPDQVAVVNEVFGVDPNDLERALRVVAGFEEAASAGRGSYVEEDGRMADLATVRWARELIARAEGMNP